MLQGIDTAAFRICRFNANNSYSGNVRTVAQISSTRSIAFCHASRSRYDFLGILRIWVDRADEDRGPVWASNDTSENEERRTENEELLVSQRLHRIQPRCAHRRHDRRQKRDND